MKVVFIHGWGFHGGVWDALIPLLEDIGVEPVLIDLGFLRGGPKGAAAIPGDALWIGHSFGVTWLLKHGTQPTRGLVSIAGFDCFHKHAPPEILPAMLEGLRRDPQAQMRQFWQICGLGDEGPGGALDTGTLRGGLQWLASWDTEAERCSLGAPILALASKDDPIVREPMTEAIWGEGEADLRWRDSGGHMLPLTQAEWCAEQISDFISGLEQ